MLSLQKARVARLRDLFEKETDPMIEELMKDSLATARLLHDIAECGVHEPERVKPKAYKRVKYAVIAISIAVVLAILFFSGCQTFKGAMGDTAWMFQKLSDNIQTQEK